MFWGAKWSSFVLCRCHRCVPCASNQAFILLGGFGNVYQIEAMGLLCSMTNDNEPVDDFAMYWKWNNYWKCSNLHFSLVIWLSLRRVCDLASPVCRHMSSCAHFQLSPWHLKLCIYILLIICIFQARESDLIFNELFMGGHNSWS
ncbi:hypothetical protein KP509_1Z100500 [Ceratopteris richardii]|nr:hypothetical protein KP509_1Z100500 [Ceratopteris richardii]